MYNLDEIYDIIGFIVTMLEKSVSLVLMTMLEMSMKFEKSTAFSREVDFTESWH